MSALAFAVQLETVVLQEYIINSEKAANDARSPSSSPLQPPHHQPPVVAVISSIGMQQQGEVMKQQQQGNNNIWHRDIVQERAAFFACGDENAG